MPRASSLLGKATMAAVLARRLALPRAVATRQSIRLSPHAVQPSSSASRASESTLASNSTTTNTNTSVSIKLPTALALAGASLLGGYCLGTSHTDQWNEMNKNRELPKGERGCCACDAEASTTTPKVELTEAQTALSSKLQKVVGKDHVIDGMTESRKNAAFLKGARLGKGSALCIVQPGTVREAVQCLQEIVDAGCVVLPQGSNTGLTGG